MKEINNPSIDECIEKIRKQDEKILLKEIENSFCDIGVFELMDIIISNVPIPENILIYKV